MSTQVRRATKDDKLTFAFLADTFLRESKYSLKMNPDKLLTNFDNVVSQDPEESSVSIFLLEVDGRVEGMLVGATSESLFSDDTLAVEIAWYVSPDHRDGRKAYKLMNEYEKWAKEKGCTFVTMMDIHGLASLEELYNRKGYSLTEKTYVKEI